MKTEEIKAIVKEFVNRFSKLDKLDDDENFIEKGYVNSLFAMQLIIFLENTFDIQIDNQEISPENFQSINNIIELVKSKMDVILD